MNLGSVALAGAIQAATMPQDAGDGESARFQLILQVADDKALKLLILGWFCTFAVIGNLWHGRGLDGSSE